MFETSEILDYVKTKCTQSWHGNMIHSILRFALGKENIRQLAKDKMYQIQLFEQSYGRHF